MQPTKLIKFSQATGLALIMAGLSSNVLANTQTYDVSFTTVADVALTPITALDFGAGIKLTSGSVCSMAIGNAPGTTYPGNTRLRIATGSADAEGANYGDLAGSGCDYTALTGTPGVYEISGNPGAVVNITLEPVSGTSFDFVPAGCASTYSGGPDGDSCTALASNSQLPVTLAVSGDTVGNSAGSGAITAGISRIVVGGVVTSNITFATDQLYTETYTIDVTY